MTKKPLRLSFLLALIQEIIVALYPLTENNTVLVGYAFQRFCARDWFNCVQACHDEPGCISYNYERSAGANGLCELNHCGVEELRLQKSATYLLLWICVSENKERKG